MKSKWPPSSFSARLSEIVPPKLTKDEILERLILKYSQKPQKPSVRGSDAKGQATFTDDDNDVETPRNNHIRTIRLDPPFENPFEEQMNVVYEVESENGKTLTILGGKLVHRG